MGKTKMSKSRGNVVDPIAAMGTYGVDVVRWYLMSTGGTLPADADYVADHLEVTYGRLQDQMGNLVARASAPSMLDRVRDKQWDSAEADAELDSLLRDTRDRYEAAYEALDLNRATNAVYDVLGTANRLFTHRQPWASDDTTACITYAYESLRIAAILAMPIIPGKATECLDRLGVPEAERSWKAATWSPSTNYTAPAEIVRRLTAGRERFKGSTMFPWLKPPSEDPAKVKKWKGKERKKAKKQAAPKPQAETA